MRALVTGAAGFIGSHLCEFLVAEGHAVVGIDDLSAGTRRNIESVPEVELVEGDLRDPGAVARAAVDCDAIFHQGAVRSVPASIKDPRRTTDVNIRGTLNVLIAAQEQGVPVIFASSSSVYGDQDRFPLSEDMSLSPRSPYAASKLAGEVYCAAWWRAFRVPTVSLRYFNVYGPRQDPTNEYAAVVPRFVMACLEGARPVIHGDGEQSRDFTYIDDVLQANLRAALAPEKAFGRAFNIGGGQSPTSVNELLAIIARLTGVRPEPVYTSPREGDVRRTEAAVDSARSLIGYRPSVDIHEGLRRTVEWFKGTSPSHSQAFLEA